MQISHKLYNSAFQSCNTSIDVSQIHNGFQTIIQRSKSDSQPVEINVDSDYDKVTESLRRKRNEKETKTISTNHRRKRIRNLASCLMLSPVIGRYRFRFVFVADFPSLCHRKGTKKLVGPQQVVSYSFNDMYFHVFSQTRLCITFN
jgi:hypothetical protein